MSYLIVKLMKQKECEKRRKEVQLPHAARRLGCLSILFGCYFAVT